MADDKRYDVALSFRYTDIGIVQEVYDRIKGRLEVFFSEARQEEIIGTDGEETFARIFSEQARIVVIFYRPDWGSTRFTRAEETAIRNRAVTESYSFTIWVPVEAGVTPPAYVPGEFLWYALSAHGAAGLAAIIENRVKQSGVMVRPESALDRMARRAREARAVEMNAAFVSSPEAWTYFNDETFRIPEIIKGALAEVKDAWEDIVFDQSIRHTGGGAEHNVQTGPYRLRITVYANSSAPKQCRVDVETLYRNEAYVNSAFESTGKQKFVVALDPRGNRGFKQAHSPDVLPLETLVEQWIHDLADKASEHALSRIRERHSDPPSEGPNWFVSSR